MLTIMACKGFTVVFYQNKKSINRNVKKMFLLQSLVTYFFGIFSVVFNYFFGKMFFQKNNLKQIVPKK
jgi:hypothetical protein